MKVELYISDATSLEIISKALREIFEHESPKHETYEVPAVPIGEPDREDPKPERKPRAKKVSLPSPIPANAETAPIVKVMDAPGPDIGAAVTVIDLMAALKTSLAPKPISYNEKITKERLQELFRAYAPTQVERAKSLLNQFGVSRLGELPEEKYAAFAAALQT